MDNLPVITPRAIFISASVVELIKSNNDSASLRVCLLLITAIFVNSPGSASLIFRAVKRSTKRLTVAKPP